MTYGKASMWTLYPSNRISANPPTRDHTRILSCGNDWVISILIVIMTVPVLLLQSRPHSLADPLAVLEHTSCHHWMSSRQPRVGVWCGGGPGECPGPGTCGCCYDDRGLHLSIQSVVGRRWLAIDQLYRWYKGCVVNYAWVYKIKGCG